MRLFLLAHLAALLVMPAIATAAPTPSQERYAVQLYSFRDELKEDLPSALAKVRALGFTHVELYDLHGLAATALRAELDKAGLHAISWHVWGHEIDADADAIFAAAKTLGVGRVGVAWIKPSIEAPLKKADLDRTAATLNAACPKAKAAGIDLFYHVHGYEFQPGDPGGRMFDAFVRALDRQCVSLQLDFYWLVYAGQDPADILERYAPQVTSFHVKDMPHDFPVGPFDGADWAGVIPDTGFAAAGDGRIDWPRIVRTARRHGIVDFILEDESANAARNISRSLSYLKAIR